MVTNQHGDPLCGTCGDLLVVPAPGRDARGRLRPARRPYCPRCRREAHDPRAGPRSIRRIA